MYGDAGELGRVSEGGHLAYALSPIARFDL